ncbi:hypothetical protein [Niveibacterium sp. COAC-50]|uniref:hypothetical protein n=1 Tax=Niveibacterium sp. COAC-50 TaxID=2729384 RepID=UPI0015552357|nr:hypothetical protein [Niveibacterium sp. COAC-50]
MANWFKEEIEQFGVVVEKSIENASQQIQQHIDSIGTEVSKQRSLTRHDVEQLIDYAAEKFGEAVDRRIEKAKVETAALITDKLNEVRSQLSDAAMEQKQTALRNATVGVVAAIAIGFFSLIYKRALHGELDLLAIFRTTVLAIACGHGVWIIIRAVTEYRNYSRQKKNLLLAGGQYFGVFNARGMLGHIVVLVAMISTWVILNYWPDLLELARARIPPFK